MNTPRLVPLPVWANLMFGEYKPHINTLRRWVNDGRISPSPIKCGRIWFVVPDAKFLGD